MLILVDGLRVVVFAPVWGVSVSGDTMPCDAKFDGGGGGGCGLIGGVSVSGDTKPCDAKLDGGDGCGLGSVTAAAEAGAAAVLGLKHGVEVSLASLVVMPSIYFDPLQ